MRAKFGFLVGLSSLFLFSTFAEAKTIQQIFDSTIQKLAGRWDYTGYATFPGCSEKVQGILVIDLNGHVMFQETDSRTCSSKHLTWYFSNSGSGGETLKIGSGGKIEIVQAIQSRFGIQPVEIFHPRVHSNRIIFLSAPLLGIPKSSFNAVAIHQ